MVKERKDTRIVLVSTIATVTKIDLCYKRLPFAGKSKIFVIKIGYISMLITKILPLVSPSSDKGLRLQPKSIFVYQNFHILCLPSGFVVSDGFVLATLANTQMIFGLPLSRCEYVPQVCLVNLYICTKILYSMLESLWVDERVRISVGQVLLTWTGTCLI